MGRLVPAPGSTASAMLVQALRGSSSATKTNKQAGEMPTPRSKVREERHMHSLIRFLVAAGAALFSVAASAQGSYPSKPITIIVPFAAGSATDTIARVVGQHLSSALKIGRAHV